MIKPGLQRISRLLAHTPLPWPAIHVAGTNGKGSICAYISALLSVYNKSSYLREAELPKLRHGRFTSPHLIDRWDCISINGDPVSGDVFRAVEAEVLRRDAEQRIGASEFEVLTATAFEIFNREKIDVGVVEVGMGGTEDATNILGQPVSGDNKVTRREPLVTVISKIGLDHQGFLGNTLSEIAEQKAGIIKPGVSVLFDPSNPREVQDVIRHVAHEKECRIYEDDRIGLLAHKKRRGKWSTAASSVKEVFSKPNSDLIPQHVLHNASLALLAVNVALSSLGCFNSVNHPKDEQDGVRLKSFWSHLQDDMLEALPRTIFPGRQQRINIETLTGRTQHILLDGAHNADSARALAEKLRQMWGKNRNYPFTWIFAASDSKDAKEIFQPLAKAGDNVVLVEFGPVDRMPWVKPMSVYNLKEAVNRALETSGGGSGVNVVEAGKDVLQALKCAIRLAEKGEKEGPLVATGSLYLVGDILRLLRNAKGIQGMRMNRSDEG